MDGQDLARALSACPALEEFDITDAVQPGADFTPLLQLPRTCHRMNIGGVAFTDEAAPTVAQLTQLTRLQVWGAPSLTDEAVKQLTALQSLRHLQLAACDSLDIHPEHLDLNGALYLTDDDDGEVTARVGTGMRGCCEVVCCACSGALNNVCGDTACCCAVHAPDFTSASVLSSLTDLLCHFFCCCCCPHFVLLCFLLTLLVVHMQDPVWQQLRKVYNMPNRSQALQG